MSKEEKLLDSEAAELDKVNSQLKELVDADRRVISKKETIGYILFNAFVGFNIDGHKDLFVDSVLKIDLNFQSMNNVIGGIWDFIDDFIVSFIVEKTRTRWGKFVPYVFLGGIPFALIATLYWILPVVLPGSVIADRTNITKFAIYVILEMAIEMMSNFRNVGIGGYVSTITPYPSDRRRLVALSGYVSIIVSRIPDLIIEFTLDIIKNGLSKSVVDAEASIGKALMIMGPLTTVVAGVVITLYTTIAKERVHQRIETPKIRESLKIVFSNRPVLMYMLSNALGSFGTGLSTNDYYRQVLNMTTFETFAGIPSFFFQPTTFANYNKLAARFSTKTIYMVSQVFAKTFYIPLFFYGICFKTKNKVEPYFFQSRIAMLPVTAVWECIYATFWGARSISITEMSNECNDYIEWKCGYRNEATLSAASAFLCKIPARINGILQPLYKKWIDYDQEAYLHILPGRQSGQPLRAQKWIFAMATIIPAFLVLSSMIPMFWYNVDKDTRDRMYVELNERRVKVAETITNSGLDAETEIEEV